MATRPVTTPLGRLGTRTPGSSGCYATRRAHALHALPTTSSSADTLRRRTSVTVLPAHNYGPCSRRGVVRRAVEGQRDQVPVETDSRGLTRLVLRKEGWQFWECTLPGEDKPRRLHYVQAGDSGPPIILVHGFGASAYHWRYNIPELAKNHRVYAPCLMGFGWSEKAVVDYSEGKVWVEQLRQFISSVVGAEEPVVLVGNSLGGFAILATAGQYPELVRGLVLLNAAGDFDETRPSTDAPTVDSPALPTAVYFEGLIEWFKRTLISLSFQFSKQPLRIKQVLNMVYVNEESVDEALIESIAYPAEDANAAEVFYRVISQAGTSGVTMNTLFSRIRAPVLLLWGSQDPWVVPARADRMQELYPADRINLANAGHCPHDDLPEEVNAAITKWVSDLA
eukprot:CAMPEP_0177757714 /NCGR_PEP_ID=MMETSP0491_2-20121128/3790_1 /TAXON_ID=63592 /ORGANISM="Tetraselmis chuii, Strain PLY429" /LENGTH=394 /DNA_ID=CAMNT_0019273383 /DNA_START=81 /DNA_END=1265 /DNA_ORIENTATION=-